MNWLNRGILESKLIYEVEMNGIVSSLESNDDRGGRERWRGAGDSPIARTGLIAIPLLLLCVVIGAPLCNRHLVSISQVQSAHNRTGIATELTRTPPNMMMNGKTEQVHGRDGSVYNVSERTALQIENYRQGTGLILNLHITHHGGTTVCSLLGRSPDAKGRAPSQSCNSEPNMTETTGYDERNKPWRTNETAEMIPIVRRHFHMIAWEFGFIGRAPHHPLSETQWENTNLVSVLVMRHPISRLLAGDGWVYGNYPSIEGDNGTREDWLDYANHTWMTNNYALRVLSEQGCCNGADTDHKYLQQAKALVKRFSIVLDIECLSDGIEAISNLLNISIARDNVRSRNYYHASSRERIGYDDVYDFLVEKNKLDIELYEWSKQRALLNCSAIRDGR